MFRDSSALVPLLLPDVRSAELSTLLRSDAEPALWWASPVECQSALYRRHREGGLPATALARALERHLRQVKRNCKIVIHEGKILFWIEELKDDPYFNYLCGVALGNIRPEDKWALLDYAYEGFSKREGR